VESLIFLPLVFGLMWLLLIRPRQRLEREHHTLVRSLEVGDEVVTTAGIYGVITALDTNVVHLLVADDVVVKVARLAIGRRADDPALPTLAPDPPARGRLADGE
jgi:preprotein translocase subunit YajC